MSANKRCGSCNDGNDDGHNDSSDDDDNDLSISPKVFATVVCGANFAKGRFSNQCFAEIDGGFEEDQCTCYESDDLMDTMTLKFGDESCVYGSEDEASNKLYECAASTGGPITALFGRRFARRLFDSRYIISNVLT